MFMNGTTMVVVIVCVVSSILYKMFNKHLEFKAKTMALNSNSDEDTDKLIKEIQALNKRIQVLETIVTDEGYQVQKDINKL
jgi:phage shock protein C